MGCRGWAQSGGGGHGLQGWPEQGGGGHGLEVVVTSSRWWPCAAGGRHVVQIVATLYTVATPQQQGWWPPPLAHSHRHGGHPAQTVAPQHGQ